MPMRHVRLFAFYTNYLILLVNDGEVDDEDAMETREELQMKTTPSVKVSKKPASKA